MKIFVVLSVLLTLCFSAFSADKVRVFIDGQGTTNASTQSGGGYGGGLFGHRSDTTVDMHNESIELAKDMREQCPEITITLKEDAADYLVKLNRESKAKKGVFDKNTQVLVANKQGDVIWTKDVRQVRSAAKDACSAISSAAGLNAAGGGVTKERDTRPQEGAATVSSLLQPTVTGRARTDQPSGPAALFEKLGIKTERASDPAGAMIMEIAPASPAAKAGLQVEYVINSVNGAVISTPEELAAAVSNHAADPELRLGYMVKTGLGWFSKAAVVKLQ